MSKLSHISEGILNEAGLSRLLTHAQHPFAVISAFRANYSLAQNRERNRQLEKRFREIGAGGIKLIGHWLEAPEGEWYGHRLDDIDQNLLQDVTEESYFVPIPPDMEMNDFRWWVVDTINRFDQDAAVLSDGVSIYVIDKADQIHKIGDTISIDKVTQAYSSIRGKNFVFEGTMSPSSITHRMLLRSRNIGWV